ncbi:MAG: cell wall hydrolase [Lachnospiraceae bacterium]|nr:cell wall hydrolase [Lachnospiraceae bacterium]
MLVLFYLAFLSILTIEITFQRIQETSEAIEAEKMEIQIGDGAEEDIERMTRVLPEAVSERRTVTEQSVTREMEYELTDEDYQTLLKIVEAEAGCEDENGKLLVANVVLNRVDSSKFPSTVRGVVYQADGGKVQFTPAYNGRLQSVKVSEETKEAVQKALYGEDISDGALYFVATSVAGEQKSGWFYRNLTYLFDYGNHSFFK